MERDEKSSHTEIPYGVKIQKWQMFGASVARSGEDMARRFAASGHFESFAKALEYFAAQPKGTMFKSGVNAYERVY